MGMNTNVCDMTSMVSRDQSDELIKCCGRCGGWINEGGEMTGGGRNREVCINF